jgi:hypothetical protein
LASITFTGGPGGARAAEAREEAAEAVEAAELQAAAAVAGAAGRCLAPQRACESAPCCCHAAFGHAS